MHKEESAPCFHNVHSCINVLHPDWKSKVGKCSGLSLHNRAFHRPEHGFCQKICRQTINGLAMNKDCCHRVVKVLRTVTMDEVSSGSARHPEGCIDTRFNLGHEVGDGAFFDVILLIMFDPEIPCGKRKLVFVM